MCYVWHLIATHQGAIETEPTQLALEGADLSEAGWRGQDISEAACGSIFWISIILAIRCTILVAVKPL